MDKPQKTPVGYMFDCLLDSITQDDNGHMFITLKTHAKINSDILDLSGQPLECAIKMLKSKKSLNANNYCWELCAALATATKLSSQDIYKEAVKHRGIYKDYTISADKFNELNALWTSFGLGWFTEKVDFATEDKIIVRCYYGTSTYNSTQMANIIDYLTEEANNTGVTTLSTRTKNKLIKEWQPISSDAYVDNTSGELSSNE